MPHHHQKVAGTARCGRRNAPRPGPCSLRRLIPCRISHAKGLQKIPLFHCPDPGLAIFRIWLNPVESGIPECHDSWATALPRHHGEAAWPNLTVGATYALPQRWIDPSWPSRKWGCAQLWLALIHPMQFILITFNNSRLFCTLVLTIWIYLTISIWLISAVHLQVPLWPVQCLQSHQIVLPRVPKQLGSHSLGKPVLNHY